MFFKENNPMILDENNNALNVIYDTKNNENNEINTSLIVPNPVSVTESPSETHYGDFSANNFVIENNDVVEINEEIKDSLVDEFFLENKDLEISKSSPNKNDCSNVYMSSLLNLFSTLNSKIDSLYLRNGSETNVFQEIKKNLILNESGKAIEIINNHLGDKDAGSSEIYKDFVNIKLKAYLLELKSQVLNMEDKLFNIKNEYSAMSNKLYSVSEKNIRLCDIIKGQEERFRKQSDTLIAESAVMKDGIISIIKENDPEFDFKSQIGEDVLKELNDLVLRKNKLLNDLREENSLKDGLLEDFKNKSNDFDLQLLSKQVMDLKGVQRKLQDENINLTQIINKLSERNNKLEAGYNKVTSELKTLNQTINRRNETIDRQKTLIEMFQEKITGMSSKLPIEDLKRKREELVRILSVEQDFLNKQNLKKEIDDCNRRISDFIRFESKKQ